MWTSIAAWTMMVAGGASASLGLLGIRGMIRSNQTTLNHAVDLMKEAQLRETSIADLETQLKPDESRFPVIVRGTVHCWGEDGKPLKGAISGADCCYYKLSNYGRPIEEKMLPLFLRDKTNPAVGIYVPWEKIYHNDDDHNITFNRADAPPPYQGTYDELFLPHGADFVAVGEAHKNGTRLELRPNSKDPRSLYLYEGTHWEVADFVDNFKYNVKVGAAMSFGLGALLFWGGWRLRGRGKGGEETK